MNISIDETSVGADNTIKDKGEKKMEKKIVFCGGGNMAELIMSAFLKNGAAEKENIVVSEVFPSRCEYLNKTYGVKAKKDVTDDMKTAKMIIIAVNPHQVESVTSVIRDNLSENTIVLSIAAGITLEKLESQLGSEKKILRVMPNTLTQTGNGHSAACINPNIDEEDKEFITKMLNALGQTMYITEIMFDTFTAYSCSGPLWFYKTVEALIDSGVYVGFSRNDARKIVVKNMLGVAKLLDETNVHPVEKVDQMCSPGGVTIEGLKVLEERGFAFDIMESVNAAVNKAKSIK